MRMQSTHREGLDPPCLGPQTHDLAGSDTEHAYLSLEDVPDQIYLAQVQNPRPMTYIYVYAYSLI